VFERQTSLYEARKAGAECWDLQGHSGLGCAVDLILLRIGRASVAIRRLVRSYVRMSAGQGASWEDTAEQGPAIRTRQALDRQGFPMCICILPSPGRIGSNKQCFRNQYMHTCLLRATDPTTRRMLCRFVHSSSIRATFISSRSISSSCFQYLHRCDFCNLYVAAHTALMRACCLPSTQYVQMFSRIVS